jgi:hypothetical protein
VINFYDYAGFSILTKVPPIKKTYQTLKNGNFSETIFCPPKDNFRGMSIICGGFSGT